MKIKNKYSLRKTSRLCGFPETLTLATAQRPRKEKNNSRLEQQLPKNIY
jgi:hypothetical protein